MHHPREGWKSAPHCSRRSHSLPKQRPAPWSSPVCPHVWPQALLCEQVLQSRALSGLAPLSSWPHRCVLASHGVLSQVALLGLEKPNAADLLVFVLHSTRAGNGQSYGWPKPLGGRPDSLRPTPRPAVWYLNNPLVSFLRWFSTLSETLLWLRPPIKFQAEQHFPISPVLWNIFCETSCVMCTPQHLVELGSCNCAFGSLWALSQHRVILRLFSTISGKIPNIALTPCAQFTILFCFDLILM